MKPRKIHSKKLPQFILFLLTFLEDISSTATLLQKQSKPITKKNEHTTYGGKKTKNYATKKTYFQFMAEKSNNLTMTKKHCLLLMAEKNYSMQKQTELWLIADSSAKEWMLQCIFRYTQKTQLDRLMYALIIQQNLNTVE